MKSIIDRIFSIKALVALMLVCAASSAWAATKLGEGITAYYDCETHTDSGTTVTVTGKKWDSGSLVADQNLTFAWNCNNEAGIGTVTVPKFSLCYSGGGTGGRCWESTTCAGLCPGTSAGDWSFSFLVVRNNNTVNNLFVNSSSGTKLTSWADADITGASSSNVGFGIYLTTGNKIGVRLSETTDGSTFNVVSIISSTSYTWNQNTWHNVIVVRSGTVLKLYVDGTFAGSATMTANSYLVDPGCLTMATSSSGGIGAQNGADEFCVWNRALFPSEIASIGSGTSAISGLVNEEAYRFSNADTDSLATTSDPSFHTATLSFKLNDPSASHAVGDFPSSGYVKLSSISIAARGDASYRDPVTAVLTNDKTGDSYTATVSYSSGNDFSASLSSAVTDSSKRTWARREVSLSFSSSYEILMDVTATYTLTFKNSSNANVDLGYSVVNKNGTGWKPVMRIYGRPASGTMVLSSSLIPSSGGASLPSTVTVKDVTGFAFDDDSVTIGNAGIQMNYTTQPLTVLMKVEDIPSTPSALVGFTLGGKSAEIVASRTATGFQNGWVSTSGGNFGNNSGNDWGAASTTSVESGEHWFAFAYASDTDYYGSNAYLDGSGVACTADPNGLRWTGGALTALTIGGSKAAINNYSDASGMVVKDIQIYTTKLTAAQVAKVTAALNDGWTVDAAGTTITSTTLSDLPNDPTVKVLGSVLIAADGTCSLVSATTVQVLAGGSLDIGTIRPTVAGVAAGGTLAVTPTGATVSQQIEGYEATVELTVTGDIDGTVTFNGDTVTPVVADGTATLTTVVPGNPTYTGESWWWDYEFNGDVTSIGSDKGGMTQEGDGTSFYNNSELYFQKTPWRNATFNDKNELTAVMYCAPGNYANTVLVGFGSTTQGGQKAIALVTGANPEAGEMKLVLTDGHSGGTGTVTELADLTAVGATTIKHLYAFVMDRITENETEKTRIRVYLDGKVKAIYKHSGTLTLSNGFQIGSLHGGVYPRDGFDTGLTKYSATGDSGTLDFLRVIDSTLTDGAMAALADAYPYNSTHGEATRDPLSGSANTWDSEDAWTQTVPGEDDETQDVPNSDTNVKLSIDGSSAVSVALNLEDDSNYESVTFSKEAGATGSLKVTSAYNNATTGKLVSAETSVLVNTTVPAGRVHLGITSVGDGVTLTVDPYSMTGSYSIYAKLGELPLGGVYEDQIISMALLGEGASVVLGPQTTLNNLGFTAELVYNESNQSYTYRLTRESASAAGAITATANADGSVTWVTHNITLPAPETIPSDFANTVTINASAYDGTITIPTAFAGGNVTVSSGSVTFSGAITTSGTVTLNSDTTLSGNTVSSTLTGTGAVTVLGTVPVTGSIANTIKGSGTLDFSGRTSQPGAMTFDPTWAGAVVLPEMASIDGDTFNFNNYGIEGSVVRLTGANAGWLPNAEVNPTVDIPSGSSLTISAFSASYANTFKKLSGAGTFSLTYDTAIDTTDGDWYSNYSAYFLVKDISCFTGSFSTATPGIAIGAAKPAYQTAGGKIYVSTSTAVTASADWTAAGGLVLDNESATLTVANSATVPEVSTSIASKRVKFADNTYSLVDAITPSSGSGDAGYVDGTTAVITNTTSSVTIPAGATSVNLSFSAGDTITLTSASVDLTRSDKVTIYATDANGAKTATDISGAFKVTAGANNTYTVALDDTANATVTVEAEEIPIKPAVRNGESDTPMGYNDAGNPEFQVKAIPGLWYAVEAADTLDGLDSPSYGTPVQATSATVKPVAPAFTTGTVKYYRIGVAPSRAALTITP